MSRKDKIDENTEVNIEEISDKGSGTKIRKNRTQGRVYAKIAVNLLISILTIVLVIVFVPKLVRIFWPFVVGFLVSMIANPLVKMMEKRFKIVRKHGSVIVLLLVIIMLVLMVYALISILINEARGFLNDIDNIYMSIISTFKSIGEKLSPLVKSMPEDTQRQINDFFGNIGKVISEWFTNLNPPELSNATVYVKNVVEFLFMMVITILAAYFFIAERDNLAAMLKEVIPDVITDYYTLIIDNFKKAAGGYFKVQFKLMGMVFIILFVGFLFMGTDYAFLLALFVAFLDFLPVFGTGTIIGPWAIMCLLTGKYLDTIFLAVIYLVCQLVKQLLQPKMVGESIGMSPMLTLVAMFIGYRIGGVFGLILGIPIGMVLISFYKIGMFDRFIKGVKIIAHDINEYRKY
ncbi:MAG: sporulation integral membrane protein YtvI [Lachnospiraceae bacterium]|nr:sporulation integral membrane protein YtvI [Lachnospiraceae bacterium]